MARQGIITTCAAAAIALALTACDDSNGEPDEVGAEDASSEEAAGDTTDDGADDADDRQADANGGDGATDGPQPDDLPDEWPAELPVHGGVELSRVMVEEMGDGSLVLTVQYRTEEDTEESAAYLASLADRGWAVDVEEGSEGMNRFVDANLEGHGWNVSVSFENRLYTWSVRAQ